MNPRFLIPDISIKAEIAAMVSAPFGRLSSSPDFGKVIALFLGVWQFVFSDLQIVAALFMFLCAGGDFWSGTKVAKLDGVYSAIAAHRGMATKMMSILIVLLIRIAEHVLFLAGDFNTNGMLAVTAAVAFGVADIRSIMYHREALGAAPIPILGTLLDRISNVLNPKAPEPPPGTPQRRQGEQDEGEGWEG